MLKLIKLLMVVCVIGVVSNVLASEARLASATPDTNTYRVAPSGSDFSGCGSTAQPCRTIQFAVNIAASGDWILVAAGTYTYNPSTDVCSGPLGSTAVVCVWNKQINIIGGYSTGNWYGSNPSANLTVIDGANSVRGVFLVGTGISTSLDMEGFTIKRGLARGIPTRPGDDKIYAFGGGMFADAAGLTLRSMIFDSNQSIGENTFSPYGGAGSGGGLAARTSTIYAFDYVTFTNNQARGGSGADRGGFGIGGGMYTYNTSINSGHDITLVNNSAVAGSSNGNGRDSIMGAYADAQGGGIAFQLFSSISLQRLYVANNSATGGAAPNGNAGGSFGGGIFSESGSVTLTDVDVRNNVARGGNGINAAAQISGTGLAWGGGVMAMNTSIMFDRMTLIANTAQGGNGQTLMGSAGGGGMALVRLSGAPATTLSNVTIADNAALMGGGTSPVVGGGGGGLWLQGVSANVMHATIAQNRINSSYMQGQGVLLLSVSTTATNVTFAFSIISDHVNSFGTAAIHVQPNNSVTFNRGLFANNTLNTNSSGSPAPSGVLSGLATMLATSSAGFVSPGGANENYHLRLNSPAINQATGSTMTDDVDGDTRTNPDIGADENVPFPLSAAPGNARITVAWQPNAGINTIVNHYTLTVTCPSGASAPIQGACGTPINTGAATQFSLTGLTNFKTYSIVVNAIDGSGALIGNSKTAQAVPTTQLLFLPLVKK